MILDRRLPAALGAVLCVAAAGLLSSDWVLRLPRPVEVPWSALEGGRTLGATLLRALFVLDALLLLRWGWRKPTPRVASPPPTSDLPVTRTEAWAVAALTVGALALRLYRIDTDLWIDEIVNLQVFRDIPPLQALVSFRIANNHVLNTLLVKGMVALAGEQEWAVRVPAVLFGAATVPALWAASRRALGRRGAFLAALLLTLSYHHVFYSQNARGYAAHAFFGVVGAGLLSRVLCAERPGFWAAYVAAMVGGVAAILHGFFVLAGHAVAVAACALSGRVPLTRPTLRRAAWALLLAGYLGLHLFVLALPDAIASVRTVYHSVAMGYRPLSLDHLQEWARGLSAGAGPGGLAVVVVALAAGALGGLRAARRDPILLSALTAPLLVMAVFVLAGRLNVTPRTFLLGLPLALVCAVAAVGDVIERLPPSAVARAEAAAAALLAAASLVALLPYYRHPKQDFRGAIGYVESVRRPQDPVLAVYLAKIGLRHYGPASGLFEGRDFVVVESVAEAEAARRPDARRYAVVTLARVNRLEYRELDDYLRKHFRLSRAFPGTLGDGDVSVWVEPD